MLVQPPPVNASAAQGGNSCTSLSCEVARDVVAALERTGLGGLKAALLGAFAILLHRQDESVDVGFATGGGAGITLDLSTDPLATEVLARVRPQHLPTGDAWRVAFTFGESTTAAAPARELDVRVASSADGIVLEWNFDAAVFERATIARLAGQYVILLRAITDDPHHPVSRLPLMTAQERLDVLDFGRGTQARYERGGTIHGRLREQAGRTPEGIAVIAEGVTFTYAELDGRANRLAHYLRSIGVAPGMPVGVAFERCAELPVTLLAILKTGAAYVPLDTAYPRDRIAFMLADANVRFVIARDGLGAEWPPSAATIVRLDASADAIAQADDAPTEHDGGPEAIAYIMYTSGSTGRPKGVAIPHRGVMRLVRGADYFDIETADVFIQLAPLGFDASTFEIWAPLLNGAGLAIPRPGLLSIEEVGRAVADFGVTTMFLTTSLFARLVESNPPTFNGLRRLLTGGEVASPARMQRFLKLYPTCRLAAVYGPTENTTFSTWCDLPTAEAIGTNVPIGRPIAHSTAYVLDAHLEPVPLGAIGELCVGGDGIAHGYLNLPEKTAERFVADPFSDATTARLYRTGDRARFRADGVLEFHGRTDDQVKIRGFRIELGEIEMALRENPAIAEAAVVAVELEPGEKSLIAHVVPVPGSHLAERDLRAGLRAKLPAYMLPHRIAVVAELPLHRSGKLDRVALARSTVAAAKLVTAAAEPSRRAATAPAPIGNTIARLWQDVLSTPAAPEGDINFFDAGGDSLRLLRLLTVLNERFALDLSVVDLFAHTTIAAQTALVKTRVARTSP